MTKTAALFLLFLVFGCSPVSDPGMTLLRGLNEYRDGIAELEKQPARWPERQKKGEALKYSYRYSVGPSADFNRLVDLDFRRREFLITLEDPSVKPERSVEIKEELVKIDRELQDLVEKVSGQAADAARAASEHPESIEARAAAGLLTLAIERFSPAGAPARAAPPSISVDNSYHVTDFGSYATVKAPDGRIHRCSTVPLDEGLATIECR